MRKDFFQICIHHLIPYMQDERRKKMMICFVNLLGPCGISQRVSLQDVPLEESMILSDGIVYFVFLEFLIRLMLMMIMSIFLIQVKLLSVTAKSMCIFVSPYPTLFYRYG